MERLVLRAALSGLENLLPHNLPANIVKRLYKARENYKTSRDYEGFILVCLFLHFQEESKDILAEIAEQFRGRVPYMSPQYLLRRLGFDLNTVQEDQKFVNTMDWSIDRYQSVLRLQLQLLKGEIEHYQPATLEDILSEERDKYIILEKLPRLKTV